MSLDTERVQAVLDAVPTNVNARAHGQISKNTVQSTAAWPRFVVQMHLLGYA